MAFKVWDWKKNGPTLTGKLTAKLRDMPPFRKWVFGFEFDNGDIWHIWGTTVLVGKLIGLNFLTKVKITYLGKGKESPEDKYDKFLFDVVILELPNRTRAAARLDKALGELVPKKARKNSQSNIKKPSKGK